MRFKKALESLKREVGQYIDEVKKSWRNTGLTLKIHFRERTYNECPEKSDVLGYTVYCPKGLIFLDKEVSDEIKKAMEKEVTQILYDLDHENEHQQALFSYVGNMVVTEFSKSISICARSEILKLLDRVGKECKWLSNILIDAKKMYEALRTAKTALAASKFEHPLSELQAIMQHKEELESESAFHNRSETFWRRFWKDGEEALHAVWPLIQILSIFDCFVPTIGYFYEAFEMAGKRIKHHHAANPQKFKELWEQFELLKPCLIWPIHVTSAYLNPSYILNERSSEDEINENEVREYMKEFLIESNEEETLENELAKYKMEDSPLFTQEAISALKTHHPVRWWEKFGEPTPLLSRCAIRLLSQPSNCLSHFCRKLKFEALKSERLDLLRLNVRMMDEFKELEEKNMIFTPIDLSKIDAPLN
uniref:HAT C-terminal dimerisation domain-containing protein n=1 Tax=Opuntia streptacantha TaxID=393608 RepID=A0A7C9ET68_OPUST